MKIISFKSDIVLVVYASSHLNSHIHDPKHLMLHSHISMIQNPLIICKNIRPRDGLQNINIWITTHIPPRSEQMEYWMQLGSAILLLLELCVLNTWLISESVWELTIFGLSWIFNVSFFSETNKQVYNPELNNHASVCLNSIPPPVALVETAQELLLWTPFKH